MEVIVVIALALTVTGAQQSELEGPENTLSVVGSNVILKCSSLFSNCSGIDWRKYIPGASPITVFKDHVGIYGAYRGRYSVDNSSGCDLVIRNVELTDAGRFICSAIISSYTVEKSAYLIILKTQPLCKINASQDNTMEGDGVQLTCEVTYNGTNGTSMVWKDVTDAPAAVDYGKTIIQSFSVVASAPEVPSFTCITSFGVNNNGSKIVGLASNVPVTTCATPAIKVLYSVRYANLSSSFAIYPTGTIIISRAEGNPAPSLKWQMLKSKINATWQNIPNATHHILTQHYFGVGQYRCVATNVMRGKLYTAISTAFQIQSDEINSAMTNFSEDGLGVGIGGFIRSGIDDGIGSGVEDGIGVGIAIGIGIGFLVAILLASITFVILARLGYLEFHPKPANEPLDGATQQMAQEISPSSRQLSTTYSLVRRTEAPLSLADDVAQQMDQEISTSSRQLSAMYSSIPTTEAPLVEEPESAYASLAQDRAANEYEAIQRKEEAKHEKSPETPDLSLYSTPREI